MVRLILPILPFRLAGMVISSGWAGWDWLAVSLYLGGNRVMLHLGERVRLVCVKERFPADWRKFA